MLAEGLAATGHEVEVVTTRPPAGMPAPRDGGLRVKRWPVLRDSEGNIRGYLNYLSFDVPLVLRLIFARRPILMVSEQPPTTGLAVWLASRLRRVPYGCYAADVWTFGAVGVGAPPVVLALLRRVESFVFRHAVQVVSVSEPMADKVRQLGVDSDLITIVPNGVDVDVFSPEGPAERSDEPYAVFTGTMSEWQGADVLIRALARTPEGTGRVVFLGQGADQARLRALASELCPDRVEFRGVLPADGAAVVIRGARLSLVPLRPDSGYSFAIPTKIFASTGCGVPVLFAGEGAGADTVLRNDLGTVVPHDEVAVAEELARAFATPLDDQTRARLAEWTRKHASLRAHGERAAQAIVRAAGLG